MMDAQDVLAAAQERIVELALTSLRGERDQARDIAVRLEQENARLLAGLREIAGLCGNTTRGNCKTIGKDRRSPYGADNWCDQCLAMDALGEL